MISISLRFITTKWSIPYEPILTVLMMTHKYAIAIAHLEIEFSGEYTLDIAISENSQAEMIANSCCCGSAVLMATTVKTVMDTTIVYAYLCV